MKTKAEIVKILEKNTPDWCETERMIALKYVSGFPDTATLTDIAIIKGSEWAYYWARDIGDRDSMRPLIKGSKWESMV